MRLLSINNIIDLATTYLKIERALTTQAGTYRYTDGLMTEKTITE